MKLAKILRIRPTGWQLTVAGRDEAEHVCQVLNDAGVHTTSLRPRPTLTDVPVYTFDAMPAVDVPLTREELESILKQSAAIVLEFEAC